MPSKKNLIDKIMPDINAPGTGISLDGTPSFGIPPKQDQSSWTLWHHRKGPLFPIFSNDSMWTKDNYWFRKNSKRFIVECITKGNFRLFCKDKEYLAQEGDVLLIHKGSSTFLRGPNKGIGSKKGICLDGSLLESLLTNTGLINFVHIPKVSKEVGSAITSIHKGINGINDTTMENISAKCYLILMLVKHKIRNAFSPEIQEVYQYLESHFLASFNQKMIVSKSNYPFGFQTLARNFRKEVGITPLEFTIELKIKYAEQQLVETNQSVEEIASKIGYEYTSYFTRQFKSRTGYSPMEYRKIKS